MNREEMREELSLRGRIWTVRKELVDLSNGDKAKRLALTKELSLCVQNLKELERQKREKIFSTAEKLIQVRQKEYQENMYLMYKDMATSESVSSIGNIGNICKIPEYTPETMPYGKIKVLQERLKQMKGSAPKEEIKSIATYLGVLRRCARKLEEEDMQKAIERNEKTGSKGLYARITAELLGKHGLYDRGKQVFIRRSDCTRQRNLVKEYGVAHNLEECIGILSADRESNGYMKRKSLFKEKIRDLKKTFLHMSRAMPKATGVRFRRLYMHELNQLQYGDDVYTVEVRLHRAFKTYISEDVKDTFDTIRFREKTFSTRQMKAMMNSLPDSEQVVLYETWDALSEGCSDIAELLLARLEFRDILNRIADDKKYDLENKVTDEEEKLANEQKRQHIEELLAYQEMKNKLLYENRIPDTATYLTDERVIANINRI